MYVILNKDGKIVDYQVQLNNWKEMWTGTNSYSKLNVPKMPVIAGEYTLDIYFNGMLTYQQTFTITQ